MRSSAVHLSVALALFALTLALHGVWYSVISEKSGAVAQIENQIRVKTETAGRVASARAAIAEIAGDEATVRSYFVSESNVVSFIDDLERRGRGQGAAVNVLSVSTAVDEPHPLLTLALTVKGSFEAVMRTVGAIEYAPYALTFSSLSMRLDDKGVWTADITLKVGAAPGAKPATR